METAAKPKIEIYTDGACSGNPGPGGWAAVLLHPKKRREESGGFRKTTNNRMELMAVIRGLELLKEPCDVRLFSDSGSDDAGVGARLEKEGLVAEDRARAECRFVGTVAGALRDSQSGILVGARTCGEC
jgi:hypothetical protein